MAASIDEVHYCMRCGAKVIRAQRFGRFHPVCPECDWVYFADPKVAAAAVIEKDGGILLVRRANDPQRGLWTLPAGFVDAGEDPARAVERECLEETGLIVKVDGLIDVLPGLEHRRGAHILIVYQAKILSGCITPGDDVDRVAFFARNHMPPLAFRATEKILAQEGFMNVDNKDGN